MVEKKIKKLFSPKKCKNGAWIPFIYIGPQKINDAMRLGPKKYCFNKNT
jgi:hypothetical protein